MRLTLRNSDEVFHYWANQVQSEGRAGNVHFVGPRVYSYGRHFCIARILPNGEALFTTRGYSVSTTRHISKARSAARHRTTLFCYDPDASARDNMAHARSEIRTTLDNAERPRLRQTTRDAHKARALHIAEQANAYLAALPEEERGAEAPIDTSALEGLRDALIAAEEASRRIYAEQQAARLVDLQTSLAKWRAGEVIQRTELSALPVALRLHKSAGTHNTGGLLPDAGSVGRDVIQTSYGAEIPVSFAPRLWALVQRVRAGGVLCDVSSLPSRALGVYHLNVIRADGSIVVGCHDIPYSELELMARELGYLTAEA